MPLIIAFLMFIMANFGYDTLPNSHIDLCNGINVDNTDKVVYVANVGYIAHFNFDDNQTFVFIYDDCFDYGAFEISPSGIEKVEF